MSVAALRAGLLEQEPERPAKRVRQDVLDVSNQHPLRHWLLMRFAAGDLSARDVCTCAAAVAPYQKAPLQSICSQRWVFTTFNELKFSWEQFTVMFLCIEVL